MAEDSGALHLKYRPKTLDEVFGNKGAISAIKTSLGIIIPEYAELPTTIPA